MYSKPMNCMVLGNNKQTLITGVERPPAVRSSDTNLYTANKAVAVRVFIMCAGPFFLPFVDLTSYAGRLMM